MFKQFLQASALQFVQIDSCRLGSVNENLAVLLMAHKFRGTNLIAGCTKCEGKAMLASGRQCEMA